MMGRIYGYTRISTKQQSIDRQIRNIREKYLDAVMVEEAFTGTSMDRPKWIQLIKQVKPGDVIVFDSNLVSVESQILCKHHMAV